MALKKAAIWYIKSGMDKEFTTVSIPTSLHKKIDEHIKGTEYGSVASYVAKILRESLAKAEPAAEVFTKDEEEKVKERLKALGYID
jgi:Arc/MetJ-type ribon-helix-helix transcriptional regulator